MFGSKKIPKKESIKQQIDEVRKQRQAVIEASTKHKLEQLQSREHQLNKQLFEIEQEQSRILSNLKPTDEEVRLWDEIKDLMEQEADQMRKLMIPEQYIRADALEHFEAPIIAKRKEIDAIKAGYAEHQKAGSRLWDEIAKLETEERVFRMKIRPVCIAGQKVFSIREKIKNLSEQRNAIKAKREAEALASIQ